MSVSNGRRRGGRPSKFSSEVREAILTAVSLGSPMTLACLNGGVGYSTFRAWMVRGEEEKSGKFREFSDKIKEAQGRAVARWLSVIEKEAAKGCWQAAAWKLERRYPEFFGRRLDVSAEVRTESVSVERKELVLRILSDDKTRDLANRLSTRLARGHPPGARTPSGDTGGNGK